LDHDASCLPIPIVMQRWNPSAWPSWHRWLLVAASPLSPVAVAPHGPPSGGASNSTAVEPPTISCKHHARIPEQWRAWPQPTPRVAHPSAASIGGSTTSQSPAVVSPSGALLVPAHGTLHGALLCVTGILWLGHDGDMLPMAGRLKPYG